MTQKTETAEMLLREYGPLITMKKLAGLLNLSYGGLCNAVYAGTLPIKTKRQGKFRVAHYEEVAKYLDNFKDGQHAGK